ncbi:hypothetical protein M0657_006459 [Pyricularia oryzae]|uniref:Uncharacterized protein n=1 Tax=Pyricularia oryzae (strain Y34) TaxID=1143189 RepID=A0AA97PQY4_PYRO3|nr:hypothetical protein OOU_Y34scaffold00126g19 [Pyricularia oryzae Y34]KAI7920766.1 hypothetical protein M0657_006459 [Pyricularia oryzae]
MEAGHGGAAVANSTLSISGILHAAAESRDDLLVLASLASNVADASDAGRALLQATDRLQRSVDVVCNLMRQLRASKKRLSPVVSNGAIPDQTRIRMLQEDPSPLAVLEKHLSTCVADIKRVIHGFRYSLSVYNQPKDPKQGLEDRRAAFEAALNQLAHITVLREQALTQHLIGLGCYVDHLVSPSSTSSGNSEHGCGHVNDDETKPKAGPSVCRHEHSAARGGGRCLKEETATIRDQSPSTVESMVNRSGDNSVHTKSSIETTVNGTASPLSDSISGDSTGTVNVSGQKRKASPDKKKNASLSRRLAELSLSRSGDSAETQINSQQPRHEYYYSCDALGGIDDGADELEDGSLSCRFCGIRFIHDDETTAYRLGAHLVRAHSFGLCNLNCTFSSQEALMEHLYSFHGWSRMSQDREVIDHWFRRQKEVGVPLERGWRLLTLEDGDAQPLRGLRETREETGLLLLHVLNTILLGADLNISMLPERPETTPPPPTEGSVAFDAGQVPMAHRFCQALTSLDKLALADTDAPKGAAASPGSKSAHGSSVKRRNRAVLEEMMYHAACVQQEIAIKSAVGDEDILRHEALYTAEQYKLDDLVCMYFPPRASPAAERHRVWHVRIATDEGGDRKAKLRAQKLRNIEGLGIKRIESNRPLRSFRDAVRVLGRAHMDQSGAAGYIGVMPQVLKAAGLLLWQEGRSPEALRPGTYVPLNAENLRVHTELQQRDTHLLANTPSQRRFRWVSGERLDWWFLGMVERSASFRRLIKSGWAFPPGPPGVPASETSKLCKSNSVKDCVAADAPKTLLTPYGWAANLLSSAGLPQGKAVVNAVRSVGGEARSIMNGNRVTAASRDPAPQQALAAALAAHQQQERRQQNMNNSHPSQERMVKRPQTPDISMVGADYGTCSGMSVEESNSSSQCSQNPEYRNGSQTLQQAVENNISRPDLIPGPVKAPAIAADSIAEEEDESEDDDEEDDDDDDDYDVDDDDQEETGDDEDEITSDSSTTSSESSS